MYALDTNRLPCEPIPRTGVQAATAPVCHSDEPHEIPAPCRTALLCILGASGPRQGWGFWSSYTSEVGEIRVFKIRLQHKPCRSGDSPAEGLGCTKSTHLNTKYSNVFLMAL